MRIPYNMASLTAFEMFATECHANARINKLIISATHVLDMWRHLPEPTNNTPLFVSDNSMTNEQGQYIGRFPSPSCKAYISWLDKEITEHRKGREQRTFD